MAILTCSIPLLLDDLIELCVDYLRDQLHPSNCVGLFLYGKQYLCHALVKAAEHYIHEHFEEVVRHEEFLSLNLHDLCSIFKNDKVKVPCESIVYNVRKYLLVLFSFSNTFLLCSLGSHAMVST